MSIIWGNLRTMKKTGKRSDKIFTRNLHKKSIFVVPSQAMTCYNQHGNKK